MDLKFRVAARIAKPVNEVFEAVADPGQLSRYFTTGGASARLETGATVTWDFHDYPGAFPVDVVEVVPGEKIVLRWEAAEGDQAVAAGGEITPANYQTQVTMTFEQAGEVTVRALVDNPEDEVARGEAFDFHQEEQEGEADNREVAGGAGTAE